MFGGVVHLVSGGIVEMIASCRRQLAYHPRKPPPQEDKEKHNRRRTLTKIDHICQPGPLRGLSYAACPRTCTPCAPRACSVAASSCPASQYYISRSTTSAPRSSSWWHTLLLSSPSTGMWDSPPRQMQSPYYAGTAFGARLSPAAAGEHALPDDAWNQSAP